MFATVPSLFFSWAISQTKPTTEAVLVSATVPTTQEERFLTVSNDAEADAIESESGGTTWVGEQGRYYATESLLQVAHRKRLLAGYQQITALGEALKGEVTFGDLPNQTKSLVNDLLSPFVSPDGKTMMQCGEGTKVVFDPGVALRLTNGSKSVTSNVLLRRPMSESHGLTQQLRNSPALQAKTSPSLGIRPNTDWPNRSTYFQGPLFVRFSTARSAPEQRAALLAEFWKLVDKYETDWKQQIEAARDQASQAIRKAVANGAESVTDLRGQTLADLPEATRRAVTDQVTKSWRELGFASPQAAVDFLATARVSSSRATVTFTFWDGSGLLGIEMP